MAESAGFTGLGILPRARSTVDLAASAIRDHIMSGASRPGAALPEVTLAQSLGVSRNTVREALRQLAAERLVVVEPNRGAFVRTLTPADVADIYQARRHLELTAIDTLPTPDTSLPGASALGAYALDASAFGAATLPTPPPAAGDVADANQRFHVELVAVHGSRRIDEFFAGLMTEMRLGFLSLPNPAAFHAAYLPRNRAIAEQLRAGEYAAARAALATYLTDAEAQVVRAVGGDHA